MLAVVNVGATAEKQLRRMPRHIADKLAAWARFVETKGLREARKIPGFHDEPLKGERQGERSIRLSKAYRAIYKTATAGVVEVVTVEEVTKHGY